MTSRIIRRGGLRAWRLIFVVLFLVPPGVRIGLRISDQGNGDSAPSDATLRIELETARSEVRKARVDLDVHGLGAIAARYEPVLCEILPLSDPSPTRSILWGLVRGPRPVPRDSVAIAVPISPAPAGSAPPGEATGRALVGRVARVYPGDSIVRVQTLFDPGFRVRFRAEGASGMLFGKGRSSDPLPLLDVRHLSESVELARGAAVFTEGDDGTYPPGILIGYVERDESGRIAVRGAVALDGLTQIVLLADRALARASELRAREARPGGSP